jgi:hypothetical protein
MKCVCQCGWIFDILCGDRAFSDTVLNFKFQGRVKSNVSLRDKFCQFLGVARFEVVAQRALTMKLFFVCVRIILFTLYAAALFCSR